nr:MAG: ORF1 [Torque teno midi virus]
MPFWWRRRKRPWYGNYRTRYRRYKTKTRRRRYRRKPRYLAGRRRRRRRKKFKVRKKLKKITLKQWQPDSIKKCKIKGLTYLAAGSQGNQYRCYTNQKKEYTVPKAPGGGGFGVEVYSLEYLYNEWKAHRNIWTTSNDYTDLCRYTGCSFILYRHQFTDFVVSYDIQPPFDFTKDTYIDAHPQNQLLSKRHKVVFSRKSKPGGKPYVRLKIKPPKLMSTKWYFQEEFAEQHLLKIQAAAADFSYSLFGWNTQSTNVTIFALNESFYQLHNWAQHHGNVPYKPYTGYPTDGLTFHLKNGTTKTILLDTYQNSISRDKGIFQTAALQAINITHGTQTTFERTIGIGRYNPELDTGEGNKVWLTSIVSDQGWSPPQDQKLIIYGKPLWMAFFGLWDWINVAKPKSQYLSTSMFVVESKFIYRLTNTTQKVWPIVDYSFIQGNLPYGEDITKQDIAQWYPTCYTQRETIAALVQSGPYIPKYANIPQSTWQLQAKYTFYFKWGGPQVSEKNVQDPKDQSTYPIPNTLWQTIQVSDPLKQNYQSLLRSWDFRRGIATTTALKRMSENIQSDTSLSSDESETPQKKRKITSEMPYKDKETEETQKCLLSLFEEDSSPEQTQDIQQLIQQQHKQQQKLKRNLILLLMNLKKKQRQLLLQTGLQ